MLKPRFASFEEDSQRSCVAINYLIAGKVSGQTLGLADGLWTLEVSDHALGRMFQRLGKGCDPGALLVGAHRKFVRLRTDVVTAAIHLREEVPVKAGAGAFICEA